MLSVLLIPCICLSSESLKLRKLLVEGVALYETIFLELSQVKWTKSESLLISITSPLDSFSTKRRSCTHLYRVFEVEDELRPRAVEHFRVHVRESRLEVLFAVERA